MTPRKMHALLFVVAKKKARDRREQLSLIAMGSRGDPKAIKKILKDDVE